MMLIIVIRYFLEFVKIYFFLKEFTKFELRKGKSFKLLSLLILVLTFFLIIVNLKNNVLDYQVIFFVSIIINLIIIFKGKIFDLVLSYFSIYFILSILDMFINNLMLLINSLFELDIIDNDFYMLVCECITFFIILIISRVQKLSSFKFCLNFRRCFFLIFISFMLGGSIAYSRMILLVNKNDIYIIINIIFSLMWILFLIIVFHYIYTQIKNEIYKTEIQYNNEINNYREQYYQMVSQKNKKMTEFKHDLKQHLKILNYLISNKKYVEAETYLFKMNETAGNLINKIVTGNDIINAIVNDCYEKYTSYEVDFKCEGLFPEKLKICMMDTCTIFSNLIINAFEAAIKSQEVRFVTISIKRINEFHLITLKNSYVVDDHNGNFFLKSSKKYSKDHGIGIGNARDKIEKNNGILEFKVFEKEIHTKILVKI